MRARQRHLNARHAGAMFVLDARFINQADNTAVSTWADRSGNGYDVSQATGANQPTLQTGEVGGSSIVRFDGSNDYLVRSDSGFPTGNLTIIGVHKQNNTISTEEYRCILHYGQASSGAAVFDSYGENAVWGSEAFGISQYGDQISIVSATQRYIIGSVYRSGTSYGVRIDGGAPATKTMTTATATYGANGLTVGSFNASLSYGSYLNGDIGTVLLFNSNLSDSLRRRFERGCGLTWKIACS